MPYKQIVIANKHKSMEKQYLSINCRLFGWLKFEINQVKYASSPYQSMKRRKKKNNVLWSFHKIPYKKILAFVFCLVPNIF